MTLDLTRAAIELAANGYTTLRVLDSKTCRALAALYDDETRFRSRVVMERHNFGRGEYKYFSYPLPAVIEELRHEYRRQHGPELPGQRAAVHRQLRSSGSTGSGENSMPSSCNSLASSGDAMP